MKQLITSFALLLSVYIVHGQNLVVNPSFEQTASNCANFGGEGFRADLNATWNNANSNIPGDSCSSPDLFAPCNTVFGISVTGMPNNELGWQNARTGQRYVGIITYSLGSNYREYIQGRTSAPLQAGQQYCVSMFVSKADNVPYATNNMGIYFSNTEYLRDACTQGSLIPVTPHLNYTCAPIADTLNWVRLQWNYTATGGEQYFVIGNFYTNANSIIQNTGPSSLNPYAYYYIDDVSIEPAGECCYTQIASVGAKCLSDAPFNLVAQVPLGANCSATLNGTWSGPGVNATTGLFTPSAAGTGTHTINFTLSCGFVASTTITVNPCAQLTLCLEPNGNLTVSGGSGNYTWASSSTVQDCSNCTFGICSPFCPGVSTTVWTTFSTTATATPPGTWPIRVTDGQGGQVLLSNTNGINACSGTIECLISIVPQNVVNACGGPTGSITVSATGGSGNLSYSWNTSPAQSGPTASNLAAGEYTVTVSDGAVCSETLTLIVQSGAVVADAGEDHVICKGESTTLNATGGTSYIWDNGAGNTASVLVSPSSTTTYTVTVTSGSCSDTDQITVTVADPVIASINPSETYFCNNASSIVLTGEPAGGTFSGPGMTGNTFSPSQAGVGVHYVNYVYYVYEECPSEASVEMTVDLCTGLEDGDHFGDVSIYPNPTEGHVTVELQSVANSRPIITLYDASGRAVVQAKRLASGQSRVALDMTALSRGIYFLRVQTDGGHSKSYPVVRD
jgi:hypothetical protein